MIWNGLLLFEQIKSSSSTDIIVIICHCYHFAIKLYLCFYNNNLGKTHKIRFGLWHQFCYLLKILKVVAPNYFCFIHKDISCSMQIALKLRVNPKRPLETWPLGAIDYLLRIMCLLSKAVKVQSGGQTRLTPHLGTLGPLSAWLVWAEWIGG